MDRCTGRHCRPVLQLPTGQSCSLQTVGTEDNLLALKPILAHMAMNRSKRSKMEWGQSTNARGQANLNGGKMLMRAVGMAGKGWQAHSPQNKATAGGHSQRILRPAQASKQQTAHRWPASQRNNSRRPTSACLSPCSAGRWGECKDVGTQEGGCRPT